MTGNGFGSNKEVEDNSDVLDEESTAVDLSIRNGINISSSGSGSGNGSAGTNNGHSQNNNYQPESAHYIANEGQFSTNGLTLYDGIDGPNNSPELRKYGLNASLRQLHYSENKISLDKLINQTIDLLYELTTENRQRPIFYPTHIDSDQETVDSHLALVRSNLSTKSIGKSKQLSLDMPEFKVLKLNLNFGVGNNSNDDITKSLNSLDKSSIAVLLEQKLSQQVKYLLNLKDRIDDTSSKVFVTGDLNAGKSTFCNALLRRKILPEDQQPCTSVFCEVIDASKDNGSEEEVHAVHKSSTYNIKDESTYDVYSLKSLSDLVYETDKYSLLKIYVIDRRPPEQSLLCNGVIDIRLIDAPGLNMDLYQTTQVFSRQEEIDLVVFVVNSENHFTLSGKDFISSSAAEKKYAFIVSNKFDNIKDKERCAKKILDQVKDLSPDTYKDAKDFVHFISSSDIVDKLPDDGDDGGDDDNPNNPDNDPEHPDFDHLEASLRRFVLEKRAVSKLLPAKNYLFNILNDLLRLAEINKKAYRDERQSKLDELKYQVAPQYDDMLGKSMKINDSVNRIIEDTCSDAYNLTKYSMIERIQNLGDTPVTPYPGIQFVFDYAKSTQKQMVDNIISSIHSCEQQSKELTTRKVDDITKLGKSTLGDEFLSDKVFQSDLMFSRKKDLIKRNLKNDIEFYDFFDPSLDSFLIWLGLPSDYIANTKLQISYYNPTSIITKIPSRAVTLREQMPTQLTLHTLYSSTKVLTAGAVVRRAYSYMYLLHPSVLKKIAAPVIVGVTGFSIYYLVSDIKNAYPRKQARKIRKQIEETDYIHNNADRISKECRKVLNYPARQVMNNFQTSIDKRNGEKERLEKLVNDADMSLYYFGNLLDKIKQEIKIVDEVNLENVNTVD